MLRSPIALLLTLWGTTLLIGCPSGEPKAAGDTVANVRDAAVLDMSQRPSGGDVRGSAPDIWTEDIGSDGTDNGSGWLDGTSGDSQLEPIVEDATPASDLYTGELGNTPDTRVEEADSGLSGDVGDIGLSDADAELTIIDDVDDADETDTDLTRIEMGEERDTDTTKPGDVSLDAPDSPPLDTSSTLGLSTRVYPTEAATVCSSGRCGPLGSGGGGRYFRTDDYLEETIDSTGLTAINRVDFGIDMDDLTTTHCAVGLLGWDVFVNGIAIGAYFWEGGTSRGRFTVTESYSFSPVTGVGATGTDYTLRIQSTATVCPGASSWNWFPGGTVTLVNE